MPRDANNLQRYLRKNLQPVAKSAPLYAAEAIRQGTTDRKPRKSMKANSQKSYTLTATGGKIAAALAKLCAEGEMGESLFRSGISQDAFCLFLAKLAKKHLDAGKTPEQLADVLLLVSGGNASAASQALGKCSITWEGETKQQSVADFWNKQGGARSAPNLSILDL